MRRAYAMVLQMLATLPLAGGALAQADCDARAKAQTDVVTRDFMARSPGKGTGEAHQVWAQGLHDALKAVEQRHEDCRKANRPPSGSPQVQREMQCLQASQERLDALDKRYQGKTMGLAEQTQRREDERRLLDERMACSRQR